MESKQIKLMTSLVKRLRSEKRNTTQIMNTFVAAGILTKSGNYTKNYPVLKEVERTMN
jgi:hypothetical protein